MYNYQRIIVTFLIVGLVAFLFKEDDKQQKDEVSGSINIEKVRFVPTKFSNKNLENLLCKDGCRN